MNRHSNFQRATSLALVLTLSMVVSLAAASSAHTTPSPSLTSPPTALPLSAASLSLPSLAAELRQLGFVTNSTAPLTLAYRNLIQTAVAQQAARIMPRYVAELRHTIPDEILYASRAIYVQPFLLQLAQLLVQFFALGLTRADAAGHAAAFALKLLGPSLLPSSPWNYPRATGFEFIWPRVAVAVGLAAIACMVFSCWRTAASNEASQAREDEARRWQATVHDLAARVARMEEAPAASSPAASPAVGSAYIKALERAQRDADRRLDSLQSTLVEQAASIAAFNAHISVCGGPRDSLQRALDKSHQHLANTLEQRATQLEQAQAQTIEVKLQETDTLGRVQALETGTTELCNNLQHTQTDVRSTELILEGVHAQVDMDKPMIETLDTRTAELARAHDKLDSDMKRQAAEGRIVARMVHRSRPQLARVTAAMDYASAMLRSNGRDIRQKAMLEAGPQGTEGQGSPMEVGPPTPTPRNGSWGTVARRGTVARMSWVPTSPQWNKWWVNRSEVRRRKMQQYRQRGHCVELRDGESGMDVDNAMEVDGFQKWRGEDQGEDDDSSDDSEQELGEHVF